MDTDHIAQALETQTFGGLPNKTLRQAAEIVRAFGVLESMAERGVEFSLTDGGYEFCSPVSAIGSTLLAAIQQVDNDE